MTRNQHAFEAITGYAPRAEDVSPPMDGWDYASPAELAYWAEQVDLDFTPADATGTLDPQRVAEAVIKYRQDLESTNDYYWLWDSLGEEE
jgi:hypothetical protein